MTPKLDDQLRRPYFALLSIAPVYFLLYSHAAERNRQMGIVAAYALALILGFPRRLGGARVLVPEGDVMMDEIGDRLHPCLARRRVLE